MDGYVGDLSAKKEKTQKDPWVPSAPPKRIWPGGGPKQTSEGEKNTDGVAVAIMALPKSERLRKKRDIENVFRRSLRYESALFSARVHKKETLPGRALVSVPKRVSKRTVDRNQLRRLVVERLRQGLDIGAYPADFVIIMKPEALKSAKPALLAEISKFQKTLFP